MNTEQSIYIYTTPV